ncbi:MAG: zf-TFIIB domain-containing protein [Thermoguttaceae bacterium]
MRLLVACPQCKRQFDVGSRAIGSRFRCYCGEVVTVRPPQGHEASVVRCSSCGAPRSEGARACKYCGADFTVHEQDLDTVCPQCFARVSDRAKFCHHCGVALRPETLRGSKTELACPACGNGASLHHRRVGDVALMECQRCAGFWLAANVLEGLVEQASRGVPIGDFRVRRPDATAESGTTVEQNGPLYRKCPACGARMNRVNYARRSGVIIDVCRKHGVWFDADELSRILVWVREGGKAEADRQQSHDAAHQAKLDDIARQFQQQRDRMHGGGAWSEPVDTSPNILVVLAEIAVDLLGWTHWGRW